MKLLQVMGAIVFSMVWVLLVYIVFVVGVEWFLSLPFLAFALIAFFLGNLILFIPTLIQGMSAYVIQWIVRRNIVAKIFTILLVLCGGVLDVILLWGDGPSGFGPVVFYVILSIAIAETTIVTVLAAITDGEFGFE